METNCGRKESKESLINGYEDESDGVGVESATFRRSFRITSEVPILKSFRNGTEETMN